MNRLMVLGILVWMGIALHAQSLYPDFSKLNFGCDGNSITAGEQWSKTVVDKLGFATHHNVAVGSATWACHPDTQDYGSEAFAGISGGWQVTEDKHELQMRHNNVSKVHIQKFIAEVESGAYPAPDVFVFGVAGLNRRAHEYAALGIMLQNGLNGPTGTARHGVDIYFIERLPFKGLFGTTQVTVIRSHREHKDIGRRVSATFHFGYELLEHYPQCRVFVCTPIQTGNPEHNALNLQKIAILRELCRALSVQLIDCYSNCGITEKFEQPSGSGRYLRDGLHPDKPGQELMGRYIAKEIRNHFF